MDQRALTGHFFFCFKAVNGIGNKKKIDCCKKNINPNRSLNTNPSFNPTPTPSPTPNPSPSNPSPRAPQV